MSIYICSTIGLSGERERKREIDKQRENKEGADRKRFFD
jgi:hypothetical protein